MTRRALNFLVLGANRTFLLAIAMAFRLLSSLVSRLRALVLVRALPPLVALLLLAIAILGDLVLFAGVVLALVALAQQGLLLLLLVEVGIVKVAA